MTETSLALCAPGTRGVITRILASPDRFDRLASLGLLPGVELTVRQSKPVLIVQIDETVLAMDHALAGLVEVAVISSTLASSSG